MTHPRFAPATSSFPVSPPTAAWSREPSPTYAQPCSSDASTAPSPGSATARCPRRSTSASTTLHDVVVLSGVPDALSTSAFPGAPAAPRGSMAPHLLQVVTWSVHLDPSRSTPPDLRIARGADRVAVVVGFALLRGARRRCTAERSLDRRAPDPRAETAGGACARRPRARSPPPTILPGDGEERGRKSAESKSFSLHQRRVLEIVKPVVLRGAGATAPHRVPMVAEKVPAPSVAIANARTEQERRSGAPPIVRTNSGDTVRRPASSA